MARKDQPLFTPPSPGKTLRDYILVGKRITQDALADATGLSRITINQIINEKRAITAETALRLSRVLNTTPEFWLNLQRGIDLYEARKALAADLAKMPVLRKTG